LQETAWDQRKERHTSPAREDGVSPGEQLGAENVEACAIRLTARPDHEITGRLLHLNISSPDFPKPAAQTIAGHRGELELRNDQSHPWLARLVVHPDHVQVLEAAAPSMGETTANVGRAGEPVSSRQARRCRQDPPCLDGRETVSRFRPFFRLRESTARPHRVAIRARNPCLLIRRLFRGRYDGFIPGILQSEPGKLVGGDRWGQVEDEGGGEDGEEGEDGEDGEDGEENRAWRTWKTWRTVEKNVLHFVFFPPSPPCPLFPSFSLSSPD